jgi:hypothetical protein
VFTARYGLGVYVFCIYMRTNSDLCHLQHKLIGFYNRNRKCLLCGTDWVFKKVKVPNTHGRFCLPPSSTAQSILQVTLTLEVSWQFFRVTYVAREDKSRSLRLSGHVDRMCEDNFGEKTRWTETFWKPKKETVYILGKSAVMVDSERCWVRILSSGYLWY